MQATHVSVQKKFEYFFHLPALNKKLFDHQHVMSVQKLLRFGGVAASVDSRDDALVVVLIL